MTNPFATAPATATATQPTTVPAIVPTVPPGEDPFSGPAPQMPRGPRLQEMWERLLILIPRKVEAITRKDDNGADRIENRMTADVIILDGGTIAYGGKPEGLPPKPHDKTAEVPMRIEGMWISSIGLVSQCRDALDSAKLGKPKMILGRLGVGEAKPNQSPPYLLSQPTEADKAIGRAYLATVDPFAATKPATS